MSVNTPSPQSSLALQITWLISLFATLFSLYLSNIKGWPVCHLCWYQRMCLYPQIIILGIAIYRQKVDVIPYSLGLLIAGFLLAIYQTLEQYIPALQKIGVCGQGPNCSDIHMQLLGFITLPMLSCLGFALLITLLSWGKHAK